MATVAGAGLGAVGSLQDGAYSAQVARNNAKTAEYNAEYAEEAGQQRASVQSMKGAARAGSIKAAQAASGIDVNTGSAVDVQVSDRMANELDAETVLNDADLAAYGYRTQATSFKAQAEQDETASYYDAAGSILSGASALGGKWSGGKPSTPKSSYSWGWSNLG